MEKRIFYCNPVFWFVGTVVVSRQKCVKFLFSSEFVEEKQTKFGTLYRLKKCVICVYLQILCSVMKLSAPILQVYSSGACISGMAMRVSSDLQDLIGDRSLMCLTQVSSVYWVNSKKNRFKRTCFTNDEFIECQNKYCNSFILTKLDTSQRS